MGAVTRVKGDLLSNIIAWVESDLLLLQNLSRWFLNVFIDLVCITEFGRLFHGSATLREKPFFLRFIFALWVNNLRECPLFPDLSDTSSHFRRFGADSLSYISCFIL